MTTLEPPRTVLAHSGLPPVELQRMRDLVHRSHEVIAAHQHHTGAYPASPTFSAYRGYAWLRDGAFVAEGMSRYGDVGSCERFHEWVSGVLTRRSGHVAELVALHRSGQDVPVDRMLPTRFTLAGDDGDDAWWDFQTDGYGLWLWALIEHQRRHGIDLERYRPAIETAVDYLTAFWDRPCFDWWEENVEQRHVSTLGAIVAGLEAAADCGLLLGPRRAAAVEAANRARALVLDEGIRGGHLSKWLGTSQVDASLAACVVPFGLLPAGSSLATATLARVAADLDVDGGVHRYGADVFYGGGRWPLLSCLLGWNLARAGDLESAWRHLRWAADQVTPDGELPEQTSSHLLHPDHYREWVDRWGTVATPLLWSHGMYLILADELGLRHETGA